MTWTGIARQEHSRKGLRYPSDMTDREWLLMAPFIPPAKSGGRKRTSDMREVVNGVLYVASSGCAWRMLPKCFPPVSTVRRHRRVILPMSGSWWSFIIVGIRFTVVVSDKKGARIVPVVRLSG